MPTSLTPTAWVAALSSLALCCSSGGAAASLSAGAARAASRPEAPPTLAEPVPTTPHALALEPDSSSDDAASGDLVMFGGWGTGDCIGLSSDVRPPACSDAAGCYKLSLMDLTIEVGAAAGGVSKDAAERSYPAGLHAVTLDTVRACFAYELERGRPPSGSLKLRLKAQAGACASSADAQVVERSVGDRTASCVRDALVRQPLPAGQGLATIELSIVMSGLN